MKKTSKTYRLSEVTLRQLERLQEYYQWNSTELIEKAVDMLEVFMLADIYDIADYSSGVLSLPNGEKKLFYEVRKR